MDNVFITDILIKNVRHLRNVQIPLSKEKIKHLMITGKNGSGKTSVLKALSIYLNSIATTTDLRQDKESLERDINNLARAKKNQEELYKIIEIEKRMEYWKNEIEKITQGICLKFNCHENTIHNKFEEGRFIIAYYQDERVFQADNPKHVEKIELKNNYTIKEMPRQNFVKYLLDLKMTEALAISGGKKEKAQKIEKWFAQFEGLLQKIFDDAALKLEFDEDTFRFSIQETGREVFDFNTLSSGYAAVLDIVVDIIMRMEKRTNKTFQFDMPGIVLIDEIETHLHLELQKNIMKLLTTIFPNIQFIVSTHSPFILNSLDNVIIYDLENHLLVENGLSDVPYDGIVEGYFRADKMSDILRDKFERYKELVQKEILTDNDFEEIAKLEMFLNEIPDYLALGITTEYQRIKLQFEKREDI
ncbi:MAG: AAA family ATPase [Lachnospiraceae bacterium]|nr:AAA family ATPase [Lachnospiraceae bacterium]